MKQKTISLLFFLIFISACGTQDYGSVDDNKPENIQQNELNDINTELYGQQEYERGYLWSSLEWFGFDESTVETIEATFIDNSDTSYFTSLGSSILGGAALGLVTKASGSWFFGAPVQTKAGHWFWQKIHIALKAGSEGSLRGAVFTGGCHLALSGIALISYNGIFGLNFTALSSATALGTMTSIASANLLDKAFNKDWSQPKSRLGKVMQKPQKVKQATLKFEKWSKQTDLRKNIRYKVTPRLFIVGLGAGAGLLVYNLLQEGDDELSE